MTMKAWMTEQRKALGTLGKVAELLGETLSTVSRVYNGKQRPAHALQLKIRALSGGLVRDVLDFVVEDVHRETENTPMNPEPQRES